MPPTPPKWRQIADEIAAQITDGTYAPGDRLPSVQTLVSEGKGATATVHRAYQALEAEGLIRTTQGSGTTVLGPDDNPRAVLTGAARLERLRRTGRALAPQERYVNSRALRRSCADPEIAQLLGIDLYDEIVLRSRTFTQGNKPTTLALNMIHPRALAALPELLDTAPMPKWRHDLYAERTGKTISPGPELSTARWASTDELEQFGLEMTADDHIPVLVMRTVYSDEDGPLEVWEDIVRPGTWHPRNA
ncbi:GntR family transcriptional regulator [Streptomyces albus]|uniref:GntR family transcriptional regulator n=1 Tax=Streptomyces albus TaxID=1888 RepID=UPI00056A92F4|nr:GntR family transcriptional regulator [Streptomyces albus]KPC78280.1 GntR family transcriptional regulator [Streptomyces sp. NRRL F-6602]